MNNIIKLSNPSHLVRIITSQRYNNVKFIKINNKILHVLRLLQLFPTVIDDMIIEYVNDEFIVKCDFRCLNKLIVLTFDRARIIMLTIGNSIIIDVSVNQLFALKRHCDNYLRFFDYYMMKYYNKTSYLSNVIGCNSDEISNYEFTVIDHKKLKYVIIMIHIILKKIYNNKSLI